MGFFGIFKGKKRRQEDESATSESVDREEKSEGDISLSANDGLTVRMEQLPTTESFDESDLTEITDRRVLEKIDALIPNAGYVGVSVGNIIKNVQATQGDRLYKVILQNGGELVDSRAMAGAKRAMTLGVNGIQENANLVEAFQALDKSAVVANAGVAVMNVASMVVGQYYMRRIDAQLSSLRSDLSKVTDFLNTQYKSEVASLAESVYNVSKFQTFSMEREEVRSRELDNIQELEKDCRRLLNQAESALENLTRKKPSNYDEYESNLKEIERWRQYQTILVKLLYQLASLDFTLHLGVKKKEQCFDLFSLHMDKLKTLHTELVDWHALQCEKFKIDLTEVRRKRQGVLGELSKTIGWIKKDFLYQTMDKQVVELIKSQTAEEIGISYSTDNFFENDVEIIAKDGKYYYLPPKRVD